MLAAHLVESIYKQYINQVTGYALFTKDAQGLLIPGMRAPNM